MVNFQMKQGTKELIQTTILIILFHVCIYYLATFNLSILMMLFLDLMFIPLWYSTLYHSKFKIKRVRMTTGDELSIVRVKWDSEKENEMPIFFLFAVTCLLIFTCLLIYFGMAEVKT